MKPLDKQARSAALIAVLAMAATVTGLPAQTTQTDQPAPPAARQGPRSVWDGVYTEDQAKRGEPICTSQCALCHGAKLTGGESAPPLVGGEFLSNWNGLTLDVLFERIRLTMPPDGPSRISRQQKADALAYILSLNKFPAGSTELQQKTELLKEIQFEARKPQGSSGGKN